MKAPKSTFKGAETWIFNQAQKNITVTKKALVEVYKQVLENIQNKMNTLKPGMSFTEKRLTAMQEKINAELKSLNATNQRIISSGYIRNFELGYYGNGYEYEKWVNSVITSTKTHVELGYYQIDRTAILSSLNQQIAGEAFKNRMLDNVLTLRKEIRRSVAVAMVEGQSAQQTARNIQSGIQGIGKAMTKSVNHSLMIARTEMNRAYSLSQEFATAQAEAAGVDVSPTWDATLDGKTRESHANADGKKFILDQNGNWIVTVGGTIFTSPRVPLYGPGKAKEIVNCFIPETKISAADIKKCYKRKYDGLLVTIETATGIKLTGTPNHPVLTENGWVGLGFLKNGDNIVSMDVGNFNNSTMPTKPNKYCKPASIGKVFKFFDIVFPNQRVRGRNVDFHGDGKQTNVKVVSVDSLLRNTRKPRLYKKIKQFCFSFSYILLCLFTGFCSKAKLIMRTLFTPNSIMRSFSKALSLKRRGLIHASKHSFTAIATFKTFFREAVIDISSGNSEPLRQLFDRYPCIMQLDKIVDINMSNYSGHVYNLQTKDNTYIAYNNSNGNRGILVHNCRCRRQNNPFGVQPVTRTARTAGGTWQEVNGNLNYNQWAKTLEGRKEIERTIADRSLRARELRIMRNARDRKLTTAERRTLADIRKQIKGRVIGNIGTRTNIA